VNEINADYTRHSLAAREIARQFFEAEKSCDPYSSEPESSCSRDR
jgi:hypothetical protein